MKSPDMRHRVEITSILANDYEFVKLGNWEAAPAVNTWRKYNRGDAIPLKHRQTNPYING